MRGWGLQLGKQAGRGQPGALRGPPSPLPRFHAASCIAAQRQQEAQRREDKLLLGHRRKDSARPGSYRTHPPWLMQRALR